MPSGSSPVTACADEITLEDLVHHLFFAAADKATNVPRFRLIRSMVEVHALRGEPPSAIHARIRHLDRL